MWTKSLRNSLPDFNRDDVLGAIGLESRRTTGDKLVPALALLGAGLVVGVGLGLLLAPKPGRELRDDLRQKLRLPDGLHNGQRAGTMVEAMQPA